MSHCRSLNETNVERECVMEFVRLVETENLAFEIEQ
jgi:hypothetical protein